MSAYSDFANRIILHDGGGIHLVPTDEERVASEKHAAYQEAFAHQQTVATRAQIRRSQRRGRLRLGHGWRVFQN